MKEIVFGNLIDAKTGETLVVSVPDEIYDNYMREEGNIQKRSRGAIEARATNFGRRFKSAAVQAHELRENE